MLTEAETREALAKVHSPKLDELRAAIPKMRTSELLGLLLNAAALVDIIDDDGADPFKCTKEQETLIGAAALLALGDEIDQDSGTVTSEEYRRICDRLARKAIAYAARRAEDENPGNVTDECEHWIDVFLDEHLPKINADVLLDVTIRADAFEKSAGRPAPSREVAAFHAFQADVWDAINRMEETADPADEETAARGMLSRYSSPKVRWRWRTGTRWTTPRAARDAAGGSACQELHR